MSRIDLLAILGVAAAVIGWPVRHLRRLSPRPASARTAAGATPASGGILDMLPPGQGVPAGTPDPNGTGRAPTNPDPRPSTR